MKKKIISVMLHAGAEALLHIEYRYCFLGIPIPIIFVVATRVSQRMTSDELENNIVHLLNAE